MNANQSIYAHRGLSDAQVSESRKKSGSNLLPKRKKKSFFRQLFENLSDPIIRILLIALAVNTALTYKNIDWTQLIGMLAAIMVSSLVSTLSERGSERAFDSLRAQSEKETVRVFRAGNIRTLEIGELVVGDVILLGAGEAVPADARIISGSLSVDQSPINGESAEAEKKPGNNFQKAFLPSECDCIFRGSLVLSGSAEAQVVRVGGDSLYGSLALELSLDARESPMRERLSALAKTISHIGYIAAALVALACVFNAICIDSAFLAPVMRAKLTDLNFMLTTLTKALTLGMTVIVVAVPEGLPMMITVVLSSNMKRMMKGGVLVRKLVGIETAGSMNILFFDKTGTVTEGHLRVKKLTDADGVNIYSRSDLKASRFARLLALQAGTNCECVRSSDGKAVGGNSTERAIFDFLGSEAINEKSVDFIPFHSSKRISASLLRDGTALYKGAPEKLLKACRGNNSRVQREISELAERSSRVIVFALGEGSISEDPRDLEYIGYAEIRDEVRASSRSSLEKLRTAGIQGVMVTGDSEKTACAVARSCDLLCESDDLRLCVITGDELSAMSDAQLSARLPSLKVVARALPSDKSRLVRVAQSLNMVVGMTGDGVNDSGALKAADVGFAMGSGTQIAREAGDIVILDDDLSSICRAVLYGRTIFCSIRKFILFQLTMNLCAVGVSLSGQLMGIDTPVTVVQMLWINMIMDTLGALAFSGEPPLDSFMREKPKKRGEKILSDPMIKRVLVMGVYVIALCSLFLRSERLRARFGYYCDPVPFLTAFFSLFVFTGVFISFASRSERMNIFANLNSNRAFIFIMTAVTLVQLSLIYFGGEAFRCCGLPLGDLLLTLCLASSVFLFDFLRRIAEKLTKHRKN